MNRHNRDAEEFEKPSRVTERRHQSPALLNSFIHSYIHSGDLYSASSSRDYYSEVLPAQSRTKKKDFREM